MKKIEVVNQRDLRDCGPCCILSILKYYGGYVPIETIRMDALTNNNGTTAFHMINTLKKYGFDAYGATVEEEKFNEKNLVVPFIAHLNLKNGLSHYVVVTKINSNVITVMDPYRGIVKLNHTDFFELFTKVVLFCYPKSELLPRHEKITNGQFIKRLIQKNQSLFFQILLSGILLVLFTILNGFYFKIGFNQLNDPVSLKLCMFFFLFIVCSKILFEFLSTYFKKFLIKNIDYELNCNLLEKIIFLPSKIVRNRTTGEIVTRVQELNNLHEIISEIIVSTIINLFLTISTFIVLYFISPILLKILVIYVIAFIGICLISNKSIYKMIKENIESNEKFNHVVIETCDSLDTIKNNQLEHFTFKKIKTKLIEYLKSNFNIIHSLNIINLSKSIVLDFMFFTIISVGFYLIIDNKLSLINFMTFESILVYFIDPIKNMMEIIPKYNYLKASLEKIIEFLTLETEKLETSTYFRNGDISVKDLEYSYNDYHQVIHNLNIEIKENEHVMLKGNSGCGKSTFCKLLNRTNEFSKGIITINNINIKNYDLKTIRKNILYLSQNEFLFDDTIKNNIILDNEYDLNKFQFICKLCHLDEFVNQKPLRYETMLNKDFTNLSGGEKQRIILARALYQNCKILILDEALSEVNLDLEKEIIKNLQNFLTNKTLIYVTHKKHDKLFNKVITIGGWYGKI